MSERLEKNRQDGERAKFEHDITPPWELELRQQEVKITQRAAKSMELTKENSGFIVGLLEKDIEAQQIELGAKWFNENQAVLKEEGVPIDISDERKAQIAIERGELRKAQEGGDPSYQQIESLGVILGGLKMTSFKIEAPILALNYLEKKADSLRGRMSQLSVAERAAAEAEFKKIFTAQKELAEKISGRDLTAEAEKDATQSMGESKEEFLSEFYLTPTRRKVFNEIVWNELQKPGVLPEQNKAQLQNNPEKVLAELDEIVPQILASLKSELAARSGMDEYLLTPESVLVFLKSGHKLDQLKRGGIFKRGVIVGNERMSKDSFIQWLRLEESKLQQEIEKQASKRLSDIYNESYEAKKTKILGDQISKLAKSPEEAAGAIDNLCNKLKKGILTEFMENELKKDRKTAEELKNIEKRFSGKGVNAKKFISDVIHRDEEKNPLGNINGTAADASILGGFFSGYGIDMGDERLSNFVKRDDYAKATKSQKGLLHILLGFVTELVGGKTSAQAPK